MKKTNCLIIKNDGIGDLIYTSGIIAELSKMFDGHVDLVTCEQNRNIAENIYGVRQRLYVSRDNLHFSHRLSRFGLLVPIINKKDREVLNHLHKTQYTYAISLRRFIRQSSLILMRSTHAKYKYCSWQFPTNTSYKIAEKWSEGWKHYSGDLAILSETSYYKHFIQNVLATDISIRPKLRGTDASTSQSEQMTVGIGLSAESSKWPVGYWIDLLTQLQKQLGWHVVLFGGEDANELGNLMEQQNRKCQNLVGKLTFLESVPYLSKLSAYIGNDSGLAHLASLVVPRCLIILGGGTFGRFFPWPNQSNQYVIYYALDCFDCDWQCKFQEKYCLHLVHPPDVISYFNEIVTSKTISHTRNLHPEIERYRVAWQRWSKEPLSLKFPPN